MKLVTFSVKKFRSITTAYKLPLAEYGALVGPNNEGKSNIMRGLVLALSVVSRHGGTVRVRSRLMIRDIEQNDFRWRRDFPIALQEEEPAGACEFVLEFEFTPNELEAFRNDVGVNLNSNLKVKILLSSNAQGSIEIVIPGKAKKTLTERAPKIAEFLAKRIVVQYVPAVRSSSMAVRVVERLIEQELSQLEAKPEYQEILTNLQALQKPILDRIGKELTNSIKGFVPDVTSVVIKTQASSAIRHCDVYIDDGALTELELKGDGLKSLAALSLLRYTSQSALGSRSLILAIEEPESHLHPGAIHNLRTVLQEIAANHQVVVSTHSPLLVDRASPSKNIVVRDGKALPAVSMADVREALGVRLSDNLAAAHLVLLVEGPTDKVVLEKWLPAKSVRLKAAIEEGEIVIESLVGAGNLAYQATFWRANLCNVHAYLDADEAGEEAANKAIEQGVLTLAELTFTKCPGMRQAEFEDLVDATCYRNGLVTAYGVDALVKQMNAMKPKWSGRMEHIFNAAGKPWNDLICMEVKRIVAECAATGAASVLPHRSGSVDALVKALESRLPA